MCEHKNFQAQVNVNYFEDRKSWLAEIQIKCVECNEPFQFLGLGMGLHISGAAMSPDGLEARIAIVPNSKLPNPVQRAMGNNKFDA